MEYNIVAMKLLYFFFIVLTFSLSLRAVAADCVISSTLRVGSTGTEVKCLQESLNLSESFRLSADGKFGPKTKASVVAWQASNRLAPDGIVGPLSRAAINGFIARGNYPAGCTSTFGFSALTGFKCDGSASPIAVGINNDIKLNVGFPKVFSVSPEKVRPGETVKIYGENFSTTRNTVLLRYGHIEDRFENLPSSEGGKVISFVYQPPEVKTMNKEELLNLSPATLNQILDPVKSVGGSIDDIVDPYRNMKNESELQQFLNNNGQSFDKLYDKFYVTVENVYGSGSSNGPILAGLRKLSIGSNLAKSDKNIFTPIIDFFAEIFTPKKAYAQLPEGGTNTGFIMYCTCGDGYLTEMTDFAGSGSGVYYWSSGFVPIVGNPMIPESQLGFYTPNVGICAIGAQPYCAYPAYNIANLPWGEAPL